MINALLWLPLAVGLVGLFLPKRLVGWWATAGAVATLAIGVIMLVLTALVLAVRYPRRVPAHLPGLLRAGVACVGVFAVVAAYPLYLVLAGPNRPRSAIRPPRGTKGGRW